jgi:hypothetical protein
MKKDWENPNQSPPQGISKRTGNHVTSGGGTVRCGVLQNDPKNMIRAWNLHSGKRSEKTSYIFSFHNIKNYQILTCSTAGRAQSHKSSLEKPRES